MSTPPSDPYGPPPEGEPQRYGPPQGQSEPPRYGPPPQGPPPQGPPPQGPPPQGPPPQAESRSGCAMAAAFAGGALGYVVFNFVVGLVALQSDEAAGFAGAAVLLALVALGGGALCFFKGSQVVKSLGMGLVFGWSVLSVVSLGYCTGLNPEFYS